MVTSTKILKWQGAMKMGEIREYCSLRSIIITDDNFFSFLLCTDCRETIKRGRQGILKPLF